MEVVPYAGEEDETDPTDTFYETDSCNETASSNDDDEKKKIPGSLLALLDDKNRSICHLKRQIQNQKDQLSFYLHRVFNSPKILEFSGNCIPLETEENIQVNLAMSQFCKQSGMKSKIMNLHGRMVDLEKRILRVLSQQEETLEKIVDKLSNCDKGTSICQFLLELRRECQSDVMMKILGATNKLRKEVDAFRVCCNRLMVIEDERNALVEQVYSVPISQRMSYGVLLAAQHEKMRLENEVKEIRKEQEMLQERFARLAEVFCPVEGNCENSGDHESVHQMLENVNSEAASLLAITVEQKSRYEGEIARLKECNVELTKEVELLKEIVKQRQDLEERLDLQIQDFQKLRDRDQCELNQYADKLQSLVEERDFFQSKLESYDGLGEQVKCLTIQVQEVDSLKAQRDYYKVQVEDLQAIRAAYAQLVDHCPVPGQMGDKEEHRVQLESKLEELEHQNGYYYEKAEKMTGVILDQESQIKCLLTIIEKLSCHKEAQTPTAKVRRTVYAVQTMTEDTDNQSGSYYSSFANHEEDKKPKEMVSACVGTLDSRKEPKERLRSPTTATTYPFNRVEKIPLAPKTSFELQSNGQEGKNDSVKAVLDANSTLEGVIAFNNSATLSLKLICSSNTDSKKSTGSVDQKESKESEMDEIELLRDSSHETVAVVLPSVRKKSCSTPTSSVKIDEVPGSERLGKHGRSISEVFHPADRLLCSGEGSRDTPTEPDQLDHKEKEEVVITCRMGGSDFENADGFDNLSSKLQQITADLDEILSRPKGKDVLLKAMKIMYGTFFKGDEM